MQRKLIFLGLLLVGCYIGLSLYLRSASAHQKQLEEQEQQNEARRPHDPPLITAVAGGNAIEVTHLLQSKADTEGKDRSSHTPLMIAAREGDQAMVKQLLAAGAHVDALDSTAKSALIYALEARRDPALIAQLLDHGADPNRQDRQGEPAFHLACDLGDTKYLELLLAHGAKVNLPDSLGQTPLLHLTLGVMDPISRKRDHTINIGALQLLLQHGADAQLRDKQGRTVLFNASGNAPAEALQILMRHGADPQIIRPDGLSALTVAGGAGQVENLKVLLANSSKKDKADLGRALALAAANGHDNAVQFLLDHGADVNNRDLRGLTPLGLAAGNSRASTIALLKQRGAIPESGK